MIHIVTYDPQTGEITAKLCVPDASHISSEHWIEISRSEYDANPEAGLKVDVALKVLIARDQGR